MYKIETMERAGRMLRMVGGEAQGLSLHHVTRHAMIIGCAVEEATQLSLLLEIMGWTSSISDAAKRVENWANPLIFIDQVSMQDLNLADIFGTAPLPIMAILVSPGVPTMSCWADAKVLVRPLRLADAERVIELSS